MWAAGVCRLVQCRVPTSRRVVSVEAAVQQERDERVRPDGDRAVLHHPRRPADRGKLRERSTQRLIHLRPRSPRLPHLQALQALSGTPPNRQLYEHLGHLTDCNFIIRQLYKNAY